MRILVYNMIILFWLQVMAVKKTIEEAQGKDSYPWSQQLLIHSGRVLKDESTLEENNIKEDSFLVVMLSKVLISNFQSRGCYFHFPHCYNSPT